VIPYPIFGYIEPFRDIFDRKERIDLGYALNWKWPLQFFK